MSRLRFTKVAVPATPAANKAELFIDTADRKLKYIDDNGVIYTLNNDGLHDFNSAVNGSFTIQQRVSTVLAAIPAASLTTRAGQVADRWAVTPGNLTTCLWSQIDSGQTPETGLMSKFYGRITQNTNAAKFILSQFLENEAICHLRGSKVRLTCKIKQFAGANAVYRLGLLQLTAAGTIDVCPTFISAIGADGVEPTWGTNLAAITPDASPVPEGGSISGVALSVTSTAVWAKASCVFTVPTTAKNLCIVIYRNTIGAASDSVGIAEVMLTQNPDLVDYVSKPFHLELLRCLRFFYKTFSYPTVPVTNAGVNTGCVKWTAGVAGAVAGTWGYFPFTIPQFKVSPIITMYNPAAANAQVRQIGATAGDCSASTSAEATTRGIAFTTTPGASAVIGTILGVHFTADSEFLN